MTIFIILQIFLDIYFLYFIILANTAIATLADNNQDIATNRIVNNIIKHWDDDDKEE